MPTQDMPNINASISSDPIAFVTLCRLAFPADFTVRSDRSETGATQVGRNGASAKRPTPANEGRHHRV